MFLLPRNRRGSIGGEYSPGVEAEGHIYLYSRVTALFVGQALYEALFLALWRRTCLSLSSILPLFLCYVIFMAMGYNKVWELKLQIARMSNCGIFLVMICFCVSLFRIRLCDFTQSERFPNSNSQVTFGKRTVLTYCVTSPWSQFLHSELHSVKMNRLKSDLSPVL